MVNQLPRVADPVRPGIAVVTMPAELDYLIVDAVRQDLSESFGPEVKVVVVDLSGTEFCDSSGLRAIGSARKLALARQVEIRLVVPGPRIRRIFKLTCFERLFSIFPTLEAALEAGPLSQPGPTA